MPWQRYTDTSHTFNYILVGIICIICKSDIGTTTRKKSMYLHKTFCEKQKKKESYNDIIIYSVPLLWPDDCTMIITRRRKEYNAICIYLLSIMCSLANNTFARVCVCVFRNDDYNNSMNGTRGWSKRHKICV